MDEKSRKLEVLLVDILGNIKEKDGRGNLRFYCPFCHHHKPKLVVNTETQQWRCWVCPEKGQRIKQLTSKLRIGSELKHRIDDIIGEIDKNVVIQYDGDRIKELLRGNIVKEKTRIRKELPRGYKPLWIPNLSDPYYINALNYLTKQRKLIKEDILKYSVGYCDEGKYDGMIIIPSYDRHGRLNYFVARSFYEELTFKKHLQAPYDGREIIGFENLINFNEELTLVEGGFDAISIRRNCIPLFGKFLSDALVLKLIKYKPPIVNICLDPDALNEALNIVIRLLGVGIKVRLVEIKGDGIDANILGFKKMWKLINNTPLINDEYAFKKYIKLKLGKG